MRQRKHPLVGRTTEQTVRDQEVLRATKELAAYFKGQRTEREARAALKIIKAFIRGREQLDPKNRPPLPSLGVSRRAGKPARALRAAGSPRFVAFESSLPPPSE